MSFDQRFESAQRGSMTDVKREVIPEIWCSDRKSTFTIWSWRWLNDELTKVTQTRRYKHAVITNAYTSNGIKISTFFFEKKSGMMFYLSNASLNITSPYNTQIDISTVGDVIQLVFCDRRRLADNQLHVKFTSGPLCHIDAHVCQKLLWLSQHCVTLAHTCV